VSKFADAWNATGNSWLDGAIAGSGGTARPIIISRILGGDPMAATQLNHGRQAEELIEAGLLLDLSDVVSWWVGRHCQPVCITRILHIGW